MRIDLKSVETGEADSLRGRSLGSTVVIGGVYPEIFVRVRVVTDQIQEVTVWSGDQRPERGGVWNRQRRAHRGRAEGCRIDTLGNKGCALDYVNHLNRRGGRRSLNRTRVLSECERIGQKQ